MGFNIRTIFDLVYDDKDDSIYIKPEKEFICENSHGFNSLIEKFLQ